MFFAGFWGVFDSLNLTHRIAVALGNGVKIHLSSVGENWREKAVVNYKTVALPLSETGVLGDGILAALDATRKAG